MQLCSPEPQSVPQEGVDTEVCAAPHPGGVGTLDEPNSTFEHSLQSFLQRLYAQQYQVHRAFSSLIDHLKRTAHAVASESDPDAALTASVRATETLYCFLFERVLVHQLDADLFFFREVERAVETRHDTASRTALVAALDSARRAPFAVHRQQARHLAELPVLHGTTPHARLPGAVKELAARRAQRRRRRDDAVDALTPSSEEPSVGEGATGSQEWNETQPSPSSTTTSVVDSTTQGRRRVPQDTALLLRTMQRVFAVSGHYSAAVQYDILHTLTHVLRLAAVLLPATTGDEDHLAGVLNCAYLVTPRAPSTAHTRVVHVRRESLELFVRHRRAAAGARDAALLTPLDPNAARVGASEKPSRDDNADDDDAELVELLEQLDSGALTTRLTTTWQDRTEPRSRTRVRERASWAGAGARPTTTLPLTTAVTCVDDPPTSCARVEGVVESQLIRYAHAEESAAGSGVTTTTQTTQTFVFQISHSLKEIRAALVDAIEGLGGRVNTSAQYDPTTTHLVLMEGMAERTEKYLSCCAAGRRIVPPRYVFDSAERGHWLHSRIAEYDMNPRHRFARLPSPPHGSPFAAWRVMLFTSNAFIAAGIRTVLRAGGCSDVISYLCDATHCTPDPATATDGADALESKLPHCTHLLVECTTMSAAPYAQHFALPPWYPAALRRVELYARTFTLELLYYCLCTGAAPVFDATSGALLAESLLAPACRVAPFTQPDLLP